MNSQPVITVTDPDQTSNPGPSNSAFAYDRKNSDGASSSFARSYHSPVPVENPPSKLSRLSLVIRRSLRLSTRRAGREEVRQKLLLIDRPNSPFTDFTDFRPEVFIEPQYGTAETLHRLMQQSQFRQLKYFVRENDWPITHEIRKELWKVLVSHDDRDFESSKLFYKDHMENLLKSKAQNFRPAFLSEPGIVICAHGLRENGVVSLQRLLIVIEYARPEIRFVPLLYPLGALFLHYHSIDVAFACINRLMAQSNRFILQSELSVYASRHTLLSLLKKFKRKVYHKLRRRMGPEMARMADVMANWHVWIFKCLPFPYLVRVVDCFLIEGQKMLARTVMALLYLWYKQEGQITVTLTNARSSSQTLLNKSNDSKRTGSEEGGIIGELNSEICWVASKIPVTLQTFLDIGFSIRRFSNGTLHRKQRHYENKFRDFIARQRIDKNSRKVDERIFTPAFNSKIVDEDAAKELMAALPPRFQLETPTILYRLSEHGTSFVQFWSRVEEADQSLLIVRTTDGHVFGAFLSSSWVERKDIKERTKTRYFGTGESFVWRLDEELKLPIVYSWSEHSCDNFFMTANDRLLIIGSGGGDAVAIRDELVEGSSGPSQTFQSPELVPGGQFQIDELEVWAIPSH